MKNQSRGQGGFTILELSVASAVVVVAVGMAFSGFLYTIRLTGQAIVQDELDVQVQNAMERIKYDLRLSALDKVFLSPAGNGPYRAMSLPLAQDDDGDGAIDLDADDKIIWDKTVIYHVWNGEPTELRMTVFEPRDNSLTAEQRQEQIDSVVANGHGRLTHNGANSLTKVVFSNLFRWNISPRGTLFDGYEAQVSRNQGVNLGSCVLDDGPHTFKFSVTGKNPASNGYKIGVDSLSASTSYGHREAEAQLPVTAQSGASAAIQYMMMGSWSGNHQLYFPATAAGQYFTLTLENDRWEETNFRRSGDDYDNTTVEFDSGLSPYDFALSLDGYGWNWWANEQSGDTYGAAIPSDSMNGCAIRVLVRGSGMTAGNWINFDGGRVWVNFRAGGIFLANLHIVNASIGECADPYSPSMDVVASSEQPLLFGGSPSVTIVGGASRWSDIANLRIEKEKSYLVTFLLGNGAGGGNPWKWNEVTDPTATGCYVMESTYVYTNEAGVATTLRASNLFSTPSWSSLPNVTPRSCTYGVQCLYTTYPTEGVYMSSAFDTGLAAPVYESLNWNAIVPPGSTLAMKVRTAHGEDMSDAPAWTNLTAVTAGAVNLSSRRYVQVQAQMRPDAGGSQTPKLRDFRVEWRGARQVVDVGGTFTKGPDYGVFELQVDGRPLITGINVQLEIFKDVRGFGKLKRITSALAAEISTRNKNR